MISELLQNREAYKYCFENECEYELYKELLPIERYFIYKSVFKKVCGKQVYSLAGEFCVENQKKYPQLADCDGSDGRGELSREIYKTLWHWEGGNTTFGKIEDKYFCGEFGGDTMNSMQTVVNWIVQYISEKPENEMFLALKKGKYSLMYSLELFCKHKEKFLLELSSVNYFNLFVDYYHTLGNFVLVPKYFNGGRYLKTFDFWDASLVWLKNDGFVYNGENIFDKEMFIKYINYFYLWDYVEFENDSYKVKPLFETHCNIENNINEWSNISSYNDLLLFLRNAYGMIRRRGIFMTILLRFKTAIDERLKNVCEEFFSYIQSDSFLKNTHKDGFKEVGIALAELFEKYEIRGDLYKEIRGELDLLFFEDFMKDIKPFAEADLEDACNIVERGFFCDLLEFAEEKGLISGEQGEKIMQYTLLCQDDYSMASEMHDRIWDCFGVTKVVFDEITSKKE